ncbi:MAG: ABC transporter ATP-binding protein [Gammaproteobacteria bacterium]|nr:ABC transporter ATP-binding protein [Gammaproteobacteria bacterium]
MSDTSPPLLSLRGMTKSFPGVVANQGVDLDLRGGEIHALLGENGAGKSTLVQMIYGVLKADAGRMLWRGQAADIRDPAAARALGIALVFQHFSLFDSLSVLENIALGLPPDDAAAGRGNRNSAAGRGNSIAGRARLRDRIHAISARYGLPLHADRHVYQLSVGERQRIEIVRCLLQAPRLLIMDEPTSVLTPQETARLFETLRQLAAEGLAVLYISHKLDEITALCRRATILRGGRVVDCVEVASESARSLAARMMGEELPDADLRRPAAAADAKALRLQVTGLSRAPAAGVAGGVALKAIDLAVRGGEIVGIAGVAGNGQDELLTALCGAADGRPGDAGRITIDGRDCAGAGARARRRMGLAAVPAERLGHGAVAAMSLADNAFLTAFERRRLLKLGFIRARACRRFAAEVVAKFKVKAPGVDALAASLSGGNLQKFIVGRELGQAPGILIVAQPTWGLDAGAAQTIRVALRALAERGAAIVVISQDLDELMELSDRIGAICAGRLSRLHDTRAVSVERMGLLMAGAGDDGAGVATVATVTAGATTESATETRHAD